MTELLVKRSTINSPCQSVKTLCFLGALALLCVGAEQAIAFPSLSGRRLFVTNNTFIGSSQQIIASNLDGSARQVIALTQGGAVDIDAFGNHIYWTEGNYGAVRRASLNGSGVETLFQAVPGFPAVLPVGLAIDPIDKRLYWSSQQVYDIRSMNLDGTDQQTLGISGLDTPYALAVDYLNEKLYWSEYRFRRINRAGLDGSSPELVVQDDGALPTVDGLALDLVEGKVYWTNRLLDRVQRANLDGSQIETIVTASGAGSNFRDIEIDPISRKLYWVDDRKDISERSYIYRANLDGTGSELLMELVGQASGLAISVPEPSAVALVLLGLAATSRYRRR